MSQPSLKTVKTTCPYCGVGCGVLATPQKDGSLEIEGDPDHPANFGRLCSKGSALGETISLDDRLLDPEINGQKASWDESLDLVAQTFAKTIEEHGPDSVAFYVSGQILTEDYYVANKLIKGFMGTANIDTNSRLCMASSVAGHKRAFGSDTVPVSYEDLENSDLLILVGSNLAWCHPVIYQRIAAAKEKRPHMKVVLVDPRETMTADIADIHLPISADGDMALFAGLMNYLNENGYTDTQFVKNHTAGIEDASVAAKDFTLKEISDETGLNEKQILEFYELYSETEKTITVYSQGVNQSSSGTDKVNAIINCHLLTGRIGKEGMGPFSVTGQPNAMGGREVGGLANMLAAHMDIDNEEHHALVEDFWNAPNLASKVGLKAVDMFKAVKEGRIKAIWIMATNPVVSMPQANEVKAALESCPFVVVSDVANNTDTLALANVKLPSLAWGEKAGTVTNSERRISRQRSLLPAPKEAKADWWQLCEVAKRMGYISEFDYEDAHEIFIEHAKLSGTQNDGKRDFDISGLSNLSKLAYENFEPVQWPIKEQKSQIDIQPKTRFFADGKFFTKTNRANFIAAKPRKKSQRQPAHLTLNTGRIRDQWHTMTRTGKSARLSAHLGEPFCEINPADAKHYGVKPASLVELKTEHGKIIVRALITNRQKIGGVFVPIHWTDQFSNMARVSSLIPSKTDPFSGQPAFKNVEVKLQPANIAQYGLLICKEKPQIPELEYWALTKCNFGWKLEFATNDNILNLSDASVWGLQKQPPDVSYLDQETGNQRYAWMNENRLETMLFSGIEPVEVSRSWAVEQIGVEFNNAADRYKIIAGRPSLDQPDKGSIVCSCLSVGANEIASAVLQGSSTVDRVGSATGAGTNCGSCRAEISKIIIENQSLAAE